MNSNAKPLPVTVLTGFLGAGKTTLLRELLTRPDGLKLGVLINDFGEINIDSALVVEGSAESVSLSNGCVCCSIQTELVDAIRGLIESRPDLDRIIVEASGVSRSLPLADTISSDELKDVAALDGTFCLVDAAAFPELDYVATELAIDQITGADLIVLNKTDLVSTDEVAQLEGRLAGLMPHLKIVRSRQGDVPRDILFGLHDFADASAHATPAHHHHDHGHGHDHHHHHGQHHHHHADHVHGPDCGCGHDHGHDHHEHDHTEAFASCSWQTDALLDEAKVAPALRRLGSSLLRGKGILRVRRNDGSVATLEYQQVGKRSRFSVIDKAGVAGSAVVAIGLKGQIDAEAFGATLDQCLASTA